MGFYMVVMVKVVVVVWHRVVVPVVNQRHDAAAVVVVRPLQSVAGPEGVRTGGATVVALDRQHALMNDNSTRPPTEPAQFNPCPPSCLGPGDTQRYKNA